MRFKIPDTKREIWVNINKYRVDWEKPARSKLQTRVKQFLYPYLKNHIVVEEFRIPKTRLTVDLIDLTEKVAYEVQGAQHQEFVPFFHGNPTSLFRQWGRDSKKQVFLEYNGYTLIQITNEDVPHLSKGYCKKKFNLDL